MALSGAEPRSGCNSRQADGGSVAEESKRLKAHVAVRNASLVVLLEEACGTAARPMTAPTLGRCRPRRWRLVSPLTRSSEFVLQTSAQCSLGTVMTARTSSPASSMSAASFGIRGRSWSATAYHWRLAGFASASAKAVPVEPIRPTDETRWRAARAARRPSRPHGHWG